MVEWSTQHTSRGRLAVGPRCVVDHEVRAATHFKGPAGRWPAVCARCANSLPNTLQGAGWPVARGVWWTAGYGLTPAHFKGPAYGGGRGVPAGRVVCHHPDSWGGLRGETISLLAISKVRSGRTPRSEGSLGIVVIPWIPGDPVEYSLFTLCVAGAEQAFQPRSGNKKGKPFSPCDDLHETGCFMFRTVHRCVTISGSSDPRVGSRSAGPSPKSRCLGW